MAAVLCAGCQLRLHVDVTVDRNGGGVLGVALTADAELVAKAARAGADPLEDLAAVGRDLADAGWRVTDDAGEDGGRTVRLSARYADAAEFEALFAQLSQALRTDEAVLLQPWTLAVGEERIHVEGVASAQPRPAVADYGVTPRQALRLLQRSEAFVYDVTVTLPGEVLSSTADAAEGSTLHWAVAPGERVDVAAESTRPGPPWIRAAAGAAAGAAVAAALLWLVARRSRKASPPQ